MDDITIRINSRTIERIVWIIIVLLLITGMVYMYFSGFGCNGRLKEIITEPEVEEPPADDSTGEAGEDEIEEDTGAGEQETGEETEEDTGDEAEEEDSEEETGQEEEDADRAEATVAEGRLELTVDTPIKVKNTMLLRKDSQYEVRGTDFAKLTAVYFKIDNNKKPFIPRIDIYVYDPDDDKENFKETLTFTTMIDKGKIFEKVERVNIGFNEINQSKNFEVHLRDESGDLLDTYRKVMTFD